MTAKQKANQARFKAVIAEAKKLRKKNPSLNQAQAVKQAWAIMYGKKRAGKKVGETHKDTKSHNVNIRVVSGIGKYVKTTRKGGKTFVHYKRKKRVGALPVGFTGKILGVPFSVFNQFNIDGTVTAQIILDKDGSIITELNGRPQDIEIGLNNWTKVLQREATGANWNSEKRIYTFNDWSKLTAKDKKETEKKIVAFLKQLNSEVREYNSGKNVATKKAKPVNINSPKRTKKSTSPKKSKSLKDDIKDILRGEKKRMKYGYTIVPGKVRGIVNIGAIPNYKDPGTAKEIAIYADSDYELYNRRKRPILINLGKKHKKGTYDIQKAAKLWKYYVDAALQKYNKEYGGRGDKWYDLMSVGDRNLLALEYAQETKQEFDLGNYTM